MMSIEIDMADAKPLQDTSNSGVSSDTTPPPSRIRIYFIRLSLLTLVQFLITLLMGTVLNLIELIRAL